MNEESKEYKQLYKWKGHRYRIECFIDKLNNQDYTTWQELKVIQKLIDKLNKMYQSKEEYDNNVSGLRSRIRECPLLFMHDFFKDLLRYNKEVKEIEHKIYKKLKKYNIVPKDMIKIIILYL